MNPANCPWPETEVLARICENDLCAWVVEPGNTASNLAYLAVGLWIAFRTPAGSSARWFAWVAIAVAFGSALYHGTGQHWARYGDFLGVFLLTGVMTALNLHRWVGISRAQRVAVALSLPGILLGLVALYPAAAVWIFALGAPCCLIELRLAVRDWQDTRYRYYLLSWLAVSVAVIAWAVDMQPRFCQPGRHLLSGHALWHVTSAVALLLTWRFYLQFSALPDEASQQPLSR